MAALLVYLLILIGILASLRAKGQPVFLLDADLWRAVGLAAILGSLGGLAYDIVAPLRPSKTWNAESFENKTTIPRTNTAVTEIDWGFVGPMVVGTVAALVAIFLFTVERPEPSATLVSGIEEQLRAAGVEETVVSDVNLGDPLPASIDPTELIWVSLVAGFAGAVLLRTASSRLVESAKGLSLAAATATVATEATNKVVPEVTKETVETAGKNAAEKVKTVLDDANLPQDQKTALRDDLNKALDEAVVATQAETEENVEQAMQALAATIRVGSVEAMDALVYPESGTSSGDD